MTRSLKDQLFTNKNGVLVLMQAPNVPLWGWIIATLAAHLFGVGKLRSLFEAIAYGSLFTWSYLEITQGINYFRRILGIIVLVILIINSLH
ncbi:MAG TPA: hypothetical protein VM124_03335 [Candidatus Limnocylindrales bacterium]|nr:hypothetical protein [Candidatus Limnocylindrales bacterium]